MRRPTVLLADDQTIVREGLKRLLEPDFDVVASVENGRELLAAARRSKPDVILLEIAMPELNGIEAARHIRKDLPSARVIFLTMHADPVCLGEAFRAGAKGYVLKRSASAELVNAIRQVLRGRTYASPEIVGEFSLANLKAGKPLARLTAREREVLQLIAEGKSAKEIAAVLKISPRTVAFHRINIIAKLGVRTTAELTQFAVRHGLIDG